ncbi:MAG: hypothetical protein WC607_01805 [Candidatus Micrarchaeia archaeon]
MKKGQSALEYLVTYGWAILAIVIIAAVLWYFGVFNPSKWTESKQCGGLASFSCVDYVVNATNGVTLSLGNKVGRSVIVYCTGNTPVNTTLGLTTPVSCTVQGTASGSNQLNFDVVYYDAASGLEHTDTGFVSAG